MDLRERWLQALESEKYPQTKGSLKTKDGFCVLGVLCQEYDPNGWVEDDSLDGTCQFPSYDNPEYLTYSQWMEENGDEYVGIDPHNDYLESHHARRWLFEEGFPPEEVTRSVGLENLACIKLADMNDSGLPFPKIAAELRRFYADGNIENFGLDPDGNPLGQT